MRMAGDTDSRGGMSWRHRTQTAGAICVSAMPGMSCTSGSILGLFQTLFNYRMAVPKRGLDPFQDLPTFLRGLIPHMAQHRGCPWPPGPWVHACAYSWGLVFTKSLAPAWTHGQKASLRVHSTGLGPGFSPFPLLCFPLKALFHGRTLHAVWHPCRGRHIIVFS